MAKQLVSIQAAAEHFDVTTRTIRRWIAEGRVTGYRVGRRLIKVDLTECEQRAVVAIDAAQAGR